jgi:hypothetical protein
LFTPASIKTLLFMEAKVNALGALSKLALAPQNAKYVGSATLGLVSS